MTWIDKQKEFYDDEVMVDVFRDVEEFCKRHPEEQDLVRLKDDKIDNKVKLWAIRQNIQKMLRKKESDIIKYHQELNDIANKIYLLFNEEEQQRAEGLDQNQVVKLKTFKNYYYLKMPRLSLRTSDKDDSLQLDKHIKVMIEDEIQRQKQFKKIRPFEQATLFFVHHFLESNAEKYDTDNIEIKKPIDGINGKLIQNDTISRIHIMHITVQDTKEYTELYVLEGHKMAEIIIGMLP